MNLETSIQVAADWWTKKVSGKLGGQVDTGDLRRILEKNIRQYIRDNFHELGYSQLTIGASGYRKDLDNIVTESVAEIIEDTTIETNREIVAKVYTEAYDSRVKYRAKAAELKAKMEARAKQLQDIALYQMLAKDDPDMAALLQEYQGLPKV